MTGGRDWKWLGDRGKENGGSGDLGYKNLPEVRFLFAARGNTV